MKPCLPIAAAVAIVSSASVHAAPVLDRESWNPDYWIGSVIGQSAGQGVKQIALVSYTAGASGVLSAIELGISNQHGGTGNAKMWVFRGDIYGTHWSSGDYETSGAITPVVTALADLATMQTTFDGEHGVTFDLSSAGMWVDAGETISFIVDGDRPSQYPNPAANTFSFWYTERSAGFAKSYTSSNSGLPFSRDDEYGVGDYQFRTFVNSAVPEPASWTMMIAGFGMTAQVLRRRRTVTTTIA